MNAGRGANRVHRCSVVAEINAASADGKISEAEKRRIKEAVVANVKSCLGAEGMRVLAEVFGLSAFARKAWRCSSWNEGSIRITRTTIAVPESSI